MRHLLAAALLAATFIPAAHPEQLPRPDHIVVVIEENRGYAQIMDKLNIKSYIHALAKLNPLSNKRVARLSESKVQGQASLVMPCVSPENSAR